MITFNFLDSYDSDQENNFLNYDFNKDDFDITNEFAPENQNSYFENIGQIQNHEPVNEDKDNHGSTENENSMLGKKRNNNSDIENIKLDKKETKESTGESSLKKIKKDIFNSKTKIERNDYLIKKFKVLCFSKYATEKINNMIRNCHFKNNLKKFKVIRPDNKVFYFKNYKVIKKFLPIQIKTIFVLQDENRKNQGKNATIFQKIFNSKDLALNPEVYEKLIAFLEMTVEEVIREYYDSKEFKHICLDEEIQKANQAFFNEKKFSFLNNYGFLKLIKNQY